LDTAPTSHAKRDPTGNESASSDLYGLGIRLGSYLQVLGMLFSCIHPKKNCGAGIKLSASAVVIAILTSWTVLVRNREISPCEAWIVLQLATVFMSPLPVALFNPATVRFEGIGIF